MFRSFTDRVLGGVCGGVGATLRINPWLLRFLFIILTVVTFGATALLYLALWWALPQASITRQNRGGFFNTLLFLFLTVVVMGAWLGQQMRWLQTSTDQTLFLPVVLVLLSLILLVRQVRV